MANKIFTKQTRKVNGETEFEVRQFGFNSFITKKEFVKAVNDGHVFFKANKPVTHNDIVNFL